MIAFLCGLFLGAQLGVFVVALCVAARDQDPILPHILKCKNCAHCEDLWMGGLWCNHPDNRNPLGCRPDDFCSDFKRKEDTDK